MAHQDRGGRVGRLALAGAGPHLGARRAAPHPAVGVHTGSCVGDAWHHHHEIFYLDSYYRPPPDCCVHGWPGLPAEEAIRTTDACVSWLEYPLIGRSGIADCPAAPFSLRTVRVT